MAPPLSPPPPPVSGRHPPTVASPIRIALVDDSAIVRGFLTRILESDPEIKVIDSAGNGAQGIEVVGKSHPDIVILDIEMPVMDGITALPKILQASPGVRVIMCSTLTVRNAEITIKALQLGAIETIAKPTNSSEIYSADAFKQDVLRLVKSIGRRTKFPAGYEPPSSPRPRSAGESASSLSSGMFSGGQNASLKTKTPYELRKLPNTHSFHPRVLAIGSSTGGPQALFTLCSGLKGMQVPIILTQHMPPTFTKILAQHIAQQTGVSAVEAENGMALENGKLYVAPGGRHMTFEKKDASSPVKVVLNDGPPENFCRPSVDPMLRSAIKIWGGHILTVILTGMGSDGLAGSRQIIEAGGQVIAQDQETSVVWGMPGAVATKGLCSAVLPLQELAPFVRQSFGRF